MPNNGFVNNYTIRVISRIAQHGDLDFTVIFHDGYQKDYKIDAYEFRAARRSERDYIEDLIMEHYQEFYGEVPNLTINFY